MAQEDMAQKATLTIEGKSYDLPIVEGSEGERAIDITRLRADTGYITFDPGFGNTGSCKSSITFIDGEKGILRYRGIPIEQFDRPEPNFIEVAWLIIFGRLPSHDELARFGHILTENAHLDEAMKPSRSRV